MSDSSSHKPAKHVGFILRLEDQYIEQIVGLYKLFDQAHALQLSTSLIEPHVSLAVGTDFDIAKSVEICEQLAREFEGKEITLRAQGFAVFPPMFDDNKCVLYTPVARSPNLCALNVRHFSTGLHCGET